MKRFLNIKYFAVVVVALLVAGCVETRRAQSGDFQILKGAKNGKIYLDGVKGASTSIEVMAKHDWEVLDTNGFVCTPNSGTPTEREVIEIKASRDNNSVDTVKLGDLHFRLLSTRFVGLSVYQLPRMKVDKKSVVLSGVAGATNRVYIESDSEFEITCPKDARFTAVKDADDEGAIVVTALEDNIEPSEISLGKFTVSLADAPSCRTTIEVLQRKNEQASQTLIFYMLGMGLSSYYNSNVNAILEALSKNIQGDTRVVLYKQSSTTDAAIYELRYDVGQDKAVQERVKNITLSLPYDMQMLERTFAEILDYAPARKYNLIVGSHGAGWLPKNTPEIMSRVMSNMGLSVEQIWQKREDALDTRHIGDNTITQYDIYEFVGAIENNNLHFDYILFDACFMSNIEAIYDMCNITSNVIASPCEIMAAGFPYNKILPHLLKDGGNGYDLDAVCREYVDYYKSTSIPSACVAHTVTSELETLAETMKAVNAAERVEGFDISSVQSYEGLSTHYFYDLEDYVLRSCTDADAIEAFKAQLAKSVLSRYHTGEFYSAYGNTQMRPINYYSGITTSVDVDVYSVEWRKTKWYRDTH